MPQERHRWQASWAVLFGFGAPILTILSIYEVIQLWPRASSEATGTERVQFGFHLHWHLSQDQSLILLAALGGLIGGLMTTMAKYARRRSKGSFNVADANWYWVRTFIGAGLGLALYVLVRSGLLLLGGSTSDDKPNPYAILGIAILVGLFTDRVMGRLKRLAGTIFDNDEEDEDADRRIVAYEPKELKKGVSDQIVKVTVSRGAGEPKILIGGTAMAREPADPKAPDTYAFKLSGGQVAAVGKLPVTVVGESGVQSVIEIDIVD